MEPDQAGAVESPGSLLSHTGARPAGFIQRPQTPRNPDQAGVGGARKPAAFIPFPIPPSSLPPSQYPNKRGPEAPWATPLRR